MKSAEQHLVDLAYSTAIEAALKASNVIAPFWPNPQNSRFNQQLALSLIEKEGIGNYATIADIQSENRIIEVIQSKPEFRRHSILSEESDEIIADENWRWIIDPIDGTQNFRNGNPDFGICIALFNGQEPILGLIAMPGLEQIAIAKKDGEAELLSYNGRLITNLRERAQIYNDPFDKALIGYDLGYYNRAEQLKDVVAKVVTKVGYASCLASFSTGNFRLLQGMMGLYFGVSPTIMDVAPAATLIPAVGGVVTDMEGKPIDWRANERSFIGAINPHIHQQFLEALKSN